jgi:7,8-dihydropterin-6-yl-methyl-4-(beta-D-ribofuranosyl)aminobenzene 5'-phosphate synthase
MRIIALIDNNRLESASELAAEHGLSLYIETREKRILFDTGVSGSFADNAVKMGIDLAAVDALVISHHHFDHGGGLERFLTLNESAAVYLRNSESENLLFRVPLLGDRYIGLDQDLLRQRADRLTFVRELTEITPGVFILTDIPDRYPVPKGNRRLFVKTDSSSKQDDFAHELVMVIREEDGLVVFTGCSHHGVLNMVTAVIEEFPGESIKGLFGGFHLIGLPVLNTMAGSKRSVRDIGQALLDLQIEHVYTGHCTGMKGYRILKEIMADKLEHFPTGSELIL